MSPKIVSLHSAICTALLTTTLVAHAADITVQPAAGSGFVIKDAAGANERLRVQESGAVTLPGVPAAAAQATGLCMSGAGLLGPCSSIGGGSSYTAATGLTLTGTTFAVAPTYQLPQTCTANQIAQWNGTVWTCTSASGATLPAGTVNQTLRYGASNAPVANSELQIFADGGVLATDAAVNAAFAGNTTPPGAIPASGKGARMMWYPAKAAFRAGYVGGTQWDDAAIGLYSFSMGVDTTASDSGSTAMGINAAATGGASTAMGLGTTASGARSTAMGESTAASGRNATAVGNGTKASGKSSTAMGHGAQASGFSSTAMGGDTIASSDYSTATGYGTTASGFISTAMGQDTTANGGVSTAMGADAEVTTNGSGSFVYGDGTAHVKNDAAHEFVVLASTATVFYSGTNGGGAQSTWPGVWLTSGAGAWSTLSDRNAKSDFAAVDVRGLLERVAALPMTTWRYNGQDKSIRHIGPIAQDFYGAFKVGEDEHHISTVDADGVALAAIQGLNAKLEEKTAAKDREIAALRAEKDREIAALERRLAAQDETLAALNRQFTAMHAQLQALQSNPQGRIVRCNYPRHRPGDTLTSVAATP